MFEIHDLVMTDFGFDRAAAFEARLSNWKPAGEIHVKGTFGPWNTTDPRMTALGADYEFNDANLDTIKGIGGILSSKGRFHGVLERIRVEGTTDTPDFQRRRRRTAGAPADPLRRGRRRHQRQYVAGARRGDPARFVAHRRARRGRAQPRT